MTAWNFNMDEAPRGETRMETRQIGKNAVEVEHHYPVQIIAAIRGTKNVTVTRWLPKEGRWNMFTAAVPPLAWQPFPTHPEATL